jgi:hypothetical protein
MRLRTIYVASLAALLAVAGCGGSTGTTGTAARSATTPAATTTTPASTTTTAAQAAKQRDCSALGIVPTSSKEGACLKDGKPFRLVNAKSALALGELTIRVRGVSKPSQLQTPLGVIKPEKGFAFIVLRLSWRHASGPSRQLNASNNQLRVRVAGGGFAPVLRAERAVPGSLFNSSALPAGRSQKVLTVLQMKKRFASAIAQRGADPELLVWKFSTKAGKDPPDGAIRLWNR